MAKKDKAEEVVSENVEPQAEAAPTPEPQIEVAPQHKIEKGLVKEIEGQVVNFIGSKGAFEPVKWFGDFDKGAGEERAVYNPFVCEGAPVGSVYAKLNSKDFFGQAKQAYVVRFPSEKHLYYVK